MLGLRVFTSRLSCASGLYQECCSQQINAGLPVPNKPERVCQVFDKTAEGQRGAFDGARLQGEAAADWGFEEMLQHNQGLRAGADGMRPYDGVAPQKQQVQYPHVGQHALMDQRHVFHG